MTPGSTGNERARAAAAVAAAAAPAASSASRHTKTGRARPHINASSSAAGASSAKRSSRRQVPFDGRCHTCNQTGWGPKPAAPHDEHERTVNKGFFCQTCVSKRVCDHDRDYERILARREQVREQVDRQLGPETTEAALLQQAYSTAPARGLALLDPFSDGDVGSVEHEADWPLDETQLTPAGHIFRLARVTRFRLRERRDQLRRASADAAAELQRTRTELAERKAKLERRRRNLASVRQRELTEEGNAHQPFRGPGAWERPHSPDTSAYSGVRRSSAQLREGMTVLEDAGPDLVHGLSNARSALVRELLFIYNISPPAGTLAYEGRILSLANRRSKSSLAAGRAPSARAQVPGQSVVASQDWTIAGVVLPQPSALTRFSSDNINGAVMLLARLLVLLASYLGILLPFKIEEQGGKFLVRPDHFWDDASKQLRPRALYLSDAAHASLVPRGDSRAAAFRHGATDMAASAISTIGSFVSLGPHRTDSSAAAPAGKDADALKSVQKFQAALMMLIYDAAYLAETQGALAEKSMDKVPPALASVPLRLLAHLCDSRMPALGERSHTAAHAPSLAFSFPRLSFSDLVQHFEQAEQAKAATRPQAPVETSYVDVAADARSVIMRDRQQHPKAAAAAVSRPATLDFLRSKGRSVAAAGAARSKVGPAEAEHPQQAKPEQGTVLFNGRPL